MISHLDLMVPSKRAKPFDDPAWVYELKHDGFRALAIRDGDRTSLMSRRGNEMSGAFPEIAAALKELPDCVLDGELVMLDAEGKPDFHKLRGRLARKGERSIAEAGRITPAAVFAFDLLALKGKDLRKLPLLKRKAQLNRLIPKPSRIVYTQHLGENGVRLFQMAEQLGLEGIIAKKADSPYQRGRTYNWLKVKTTTGRQIDQDRAKWNE